MKTSEKDIIYKIEKNKQKDISMIKFNNILKKKDSKELLVKNKFSLLFCPKIFTKKNLEIKHYDRLTNCLGTSGRRNAIYNNERVCHTERKNYFSDE